jgi:hypothetical protein
MKANKKYTIVEDDKGMIQMLPVVAFAIIMLFAILYIGTYINGTISSQLVESYGTPASRTSLENETVNTLGNLTDDYDNITEIVAIAAIIVVLTVPLMAVVALKRLL